MRSRCTACDEHANFKFSANGSSHKLGIRPFPLSRNRSSASPLAPSFTVNNKTNPQFWQKLGVVAMHFVFAFIFQLAAVMSKSRVHINSAFPHSRRRLIAKVHNPEGAGQGKGTPLEKN